MGSLSGIVVGIALGNPPVRYICLQSLSGRYYKSEYCGSCTNSSTDLSAQCFLVLHVAFDSPLFCLLRLLSSKP